MPRFQLCLRSSDWAAFASKSGCCVSFPNWSIYALFIDSLRLLSLQLFVPSNFPPLPCLIFLIYSFENLSSSGRILHVTR